MTPEEKIKRIREIIFETNGVAASQEFGLTYGQLIDYLKQIEEIVCDEIWNLSQELVI